MLLVESIAPAQFERKNASEYILCFCAKRNVNLQSSNTNAPPSALHYQAAADFAKAHLPEALRQQLLTYEREKERDREKDKEKEEKKERGGLSYPSILEQQILTLDREMLDKLSATYNEAGVCLQLVKIPPIISECVHLVFVLVFVATRTRRPHTDGFLPLSDAHCRGHNNKAPVSPVEMFSNVSF